MGMQLPTAARIMPQAPAARLTGAERAFRLSDRIHEGFRSAARGLAAALILVSAGIGAQPQGVPQQGLPRTELTAGMHRIVAEVAADHASRATGLMFRRSLAPNHGMLFVFQDKSPQCFWMRNTLIPLSIAFIDDDGRIVNIEDMAPMTETSHCSKEPVRFALEMEQGWFQRRGVSAGDWLGGREVFKPR
jgi:uncharacterized membrane protein (UPF0127 family)